MSLTFRSSAPEERVIIERHPDGRQRVATAPREGNQWVCKLKHPSGETWTERYNGDRVVEAMGNWMASKRHKFDDDKHLGDQKPYRPETTVQIGENHPDYFKR
jgi:hypothetical protein